MLSLVSEVVCFLFLRLRLRGFLFDESGAVKLLYDFGSLLEGTALYRSGSLSFLFKVRALENGICPDVVWGESVVVVTSGTSGLGSS